MTAIQPSSEHNKNISNLISNYQTQSNQEKVSTGKELGKDNVSISQEFAKGTSTGSSQAISNAKETANIDKQNQTEKVSTPSDVNKVTAAKSVAASQADTNIKSQTNRQSRSVDQSQTNKNNQINSVVSTQSMKACSFCKGAGCPACKQELASFFTQEDQHKIKSIDELSKQERIRQKKKTIEMVDKFDKVSHIKKVDPDNRSNSLPGQISNSINLFADNDT